VTSHVCHKYFGVSYIFLRDFLCASVSVNVYVASCGCFVCVFYVDIMFVFFL
jgi:hypothetical protein